MENLIVSEKRNENTSFIYQNEKLGFSEMDVLRKAYELILENSDHFFSELTSAFTIERDNRESKLLI